MYCLCGCGQEVQGQRKNRKFVDDAHRQAYWRRQRQAETKDTITALRRALEEAKLQIAGLEQEVTRLRNKLDIERHFHEDHTARGFRAWLRKQPAGRIGEVGRRILADGFIPNVGSRALYEAHLRSHQYSGDDLAEFAHLWKLMLLS